MDTEIKHAGNQPAEAENEAILEAIRKSEEKADKMIEEANIRKARIIEDAKKETLKLLADADSNISKKTDIELVNFKKELEKQKTMLLEENKKQSQQLKKNAEKNIGKASSFLIEKFQHSV